MRSSIFNESGFHYSRLVTRPWNQKHKCICIYICIHVYMYIFICKIYTYYILYQMSTIFSLDVFLCFAQPRVLGPCALLASMVCKELLQHPRQLALTVRLANSLPRKVCLYVFITL